MSEPNDRKTFTKRDAAALARLQGKPPPAHLIDKVMSGIAKETPVKRVRKPELPRRSPQNTKTISKGREKNR
ncbi:hypothetical protein [Cerasicoccus fimbriatus]|uniref:hypothetical protein n=1 Tax=Cerasicoccus fimbriatus TaxID=3014554 RepID=UPI0022B4CAC3|nr:hypothetical protein [Cerasicoccus sp. TK19100]